MSTPGLLSSRDRIASAAKELFAKNGYENTSTVAIARQAGTSESQLMKHFGSKQGLLFAIVDQGWTAILHRAYALSSAPVRSPQCLIDVLESYIVELEQDSAMRTLVVLESRRARRESVGPSPAEGSQQFGALIESLLRDLKHQGAVRAELNLTATRAALFGMMEGLMLEEVLSAHDDRQPLCGLDEVRRVLEAFVSGLTHDTLTAQGTEQHTASWGHAD
ncbi:MAG: TetR/AcrR family transcriptional regulator [Candidatus Korobacteraceae bacterium]